MGKNRYPAKGKKGTNGKKYNLRGKRFFLIQGQINRRPWQKLKGSNLKRKSKIAKGTGQKKREKPPRGTCEPNSESSAISQEVQKEGRIA